MKWFVTKIKHIITKFVTCLNDGQQFDFTLVYLGCQLSRQPCKNIPVSYKIREYNTINTKTLDNRISFRIKDVSGA